MAQDDRGVVRQRATTLLAPLRIRYFRRLWLADIVSLLGDWAGRLAAKSPVLMRLGHDAMYRQQDMALDDALEFLRSQLSLTFTTEDIVEGVTAFFEKRDPQWKGR